MSNLLGKVINGRLEPEFSTELPPSNKQKNKFKQRRKSYVIVGKGALCPNCEKPMQEREHSRLTLKHKTAPYYFIKWDYCPDCKFLQHYEDQKVFNKNRKGKYFKAKQSQEKYDEELAEKFKNL